MNQADIIRMAREAGLIHFYDSEGHCTGITDAPLFTADSDRNDDRLVEMLAPFAALVATAEREAIKWNSIHSCHADCQNPACVIVREAVAAEREECAKLFDGEVWAYDYREIAAAIRARGQQ